MSRRCGSSKPTPTFLNGEALKPTRNAKKKRGKMGGKGGLFVRDSKTIKESYHNIT